MRKSQILKSCNRMLLAVTVAILASSIQLEVTSGNSRVWVWIHIILGMTFLYLTAWHLQIHYQWRNWLKLLWKQKHANTKWLTALGILTFVSAIVCTAGWLVSPTHSRIGAVHGKFGFVFLAIAIWHIVRRIKFYYKK